MKQMIYSLIFLSFCLSSTIISQNPDWKNYTNNSIINAIEIEGNYLWLGTDGGLVKYDIVSGEKLFYEKSNSGLPFNRISSIAIDSAGNKWIGTGEKHSDVGGGLAKFDGSEWIVYNITNSKIPSNSVYCIAIDTLGVKWIGTEKGLVKIADLNGTIYFSPYSSQIIRCITVDESNNKWVGTSAGLFELDNTVLTKIHEVWNSGVSCIAIDIDGSIWAGERSGGLAKIDKNGIQYIYNSSHVYDGAISLAVDEKGNKWFGTDYSGLAKYDNDTLTWYNLNIFQERGYGVSAIKILNSGNKWIGCKYVQGWSGDYVGIGLARYNGTELKLIDNLSEEILSNDVRSITIDNENNKWIGTFGGLSKFDGTKWETYNSDNSGLSHNLISCTANDSNGELWIGSIYGSTLTKYDGKDWTVYDESNSKFQFSSQCIVIDKMDKKWVGTWSGLVTFDDHLWDLLDKSSGMPFNNIRCIAIDSLENIWLGGYDYNDGNEIGGLVKYDGNLTFFNESNSGIPSKYVNSIFIDKQNNIWIGTGEGLAIFDGIDNWKVYNESNSDLPGNWVEDISMDESNNLWVGTNEGLAKFDGTNWTIYNESNTELPLNAICCVSAEKYGNVWIGSGGWNGYGGGVSVFNETGIVLVEENPTDGETIPKDYLLSQNYPNPFNPSTTIKYQLPSKVKSETANGFIPSGVEGDLVQLKIYDTLGREIATLVNQKQKPGNYEVEWNAIKQPSGVYFYQLTAGSFTQTKKMILLR